MSDCRICHANEQRLSPPIELQEVVVTTELCDDHGRPIIAFLRDANHGHFIDAGLPISVIKLAGAAGALTFKGYRMTFTTRPPADEADCLVCEANEQKITSGTHMKPITKDSMCEPHGRELVRALIASGAREAETLLKSGTPCHIEINLGGQPGALTIAAAKVHVKGN